MNFVPTIDRGAIRATVRYSQLDDMSMEAIVHNYHELPVSTGDYLDGKNFDEVVNQRYEEFKKFTGAVGTNVGFTRPEEEKDNIWWVLYKQVQDHKNYKGEKYCGVVVTNWNTSTVKHVVVWESEWDDFCKMFNYRSGCELTTPQFEYGDLPFSK